MADDKKREITRIVTGNLRRQSKVDKALKVFFSEDARTVGETLRDDYVIPFLKNAAVTALEMFLFGAASRTVRDRGRSHVSYNRFYDSDRDTRGSITRRNMDTCPTTFDYLNYDFNTLEEVLDIIDDMSNLVGEYHYARVADLNQKIGITGQWTDQNWGWTDCRSFHWRRSGGKYILDFAMPIPLDNH